MTKILGKGIKFMALLLCFLMVISFTACKELDEDYGKNPMEENKGQNAELVYPEIKSSDTVMPKYFDISLFDEENYSKCYLGDDFKFNITYSGSVINLPTSYSKTVKNGWEIEENSVYKEDSVLTAGKAVEVILKNKYNNQIKAVFKNFARSSKKLSKCDIVKFIIPENALNVENSLYGHFWINGITNQSAINNIVEYLGVPSHFYAVSQNHYYLDYFFSEKDKRSGITIHVDPQNDIILSIEFANYN